MPSNTQPDAKIPKKPPKEWTIIIYCAGDNALSPMIVSQLKELKDAGSHPDVNVLVYFDPNETGVPTQLYCINKNNGHRKSSPDDSFVHSLAADYVKIQGPEGSAADDLRQELRRPDQTKAVDALSMFLRFCREQYSAKHYALVLLGHGMVVANDAFLPDEAPESSITLRELGTTLRGFDGKLELLALHSCSMSAVEVAYQLKGKAKYMIASEGLAFVNGWPYRKLLLRTYSLLKEADARNGNGNGRARRRAQALDVRQLVERLYKLSSYNGLDFMLSGYSQDLALINLDREKFLPLTKVIQKLVIQLKVALEDESCVPKQLIQLAHLESQSYFNENYTDLYDFCFCLFKNCKSRGLVDLRNACRDVMEVLESNKSEEIGERFDRLVIHSRHFGSLYQHSHGLSIYFPWSKPLGDAKGSVLTRYNRYRFNRELKKNSWLSFLNLYLKKTEREAREADTHIGRAFRTFGVGGVSALVDPADHKTSGASGPACGCTSIKNFPTEKREFKGTKCFTRKLTMSQELRERQQ